MSTLSDKMKQLTSEERSVAEALKFLLQSGYVTIGVDIEPVAYPHRGYNVTKTWARIGEETIELETGNVELVYTDENG